MITVLGDSVAVDPNPSPLEYIAVFLPLRDVDRRRTLSGIPRRLTRDRERFFFRRVLENSPR